MKALLEQKAQVLRLRKRGLSYKDIQKLVPVAKSSISLWLRDVSLTELEKQALKQRRNSNISSGRRKAAGILYQKRLDRESLWFQEAQIVFQKYKHDPFFFTGIALYWAEGSKRVNQWGFTNSDVDMSEMMLFWLEKYTGIHRGDLHFRLYIHKLYAHENCEAWWQKKLHVAQSQFGKTTYKPTSRGVKKRPDYKGCLRIEVRKSKGLLLKMKFWQKMMVDSLRK